MPCSKHPQAGHYKSGQCKDCHRQSKHNMVKQDRFWTHQGNAKKRGIEWTLTYEQWLAVVSQTCAYALPGDSGQIIGIDRKDSSQGYTVVNSQACCQHHNQVKSDVFTHEQMLDLASRYSVHCGDKPRGRTQ